MHFLLRSIFGVYISEKALKFYAENYFKLSEVPGSNLPS